MPISKNQHAGSKKELMHLSQIYDYIFDIVCVRIFQRLIYRTNSGFAWLSYIIGIILHVVGWKTLDALKNICGGKAKIKFKPKSEVILLIFIYSVFD